MSYTQPSRQDPRRGSSMVEFGLTFGLILMLFVGIFEMGRAVWSYTTVAYAAREAARYAVVRSSLGASGADTSPIDNVVYSNAVGLDPNKLVVTKTWSPDNKVGSEVEITVSYPIDFVGAPLFLSNRTGLNVSASAAYTLLN